MATAEPRWSLRAATRDDLRGIQAIENRCFGSPWDLDAYRQELDERRGSLTVAVSSGRAVVGFVCVWHIFEDAQLLRIATDPRWWRMGIARGLIHHAIRLAQSAHCERMTLEVGASNRSAFCLYQSFGFEEIGRRTGYYRCPPDDAIVMECRLLSSTGTERAQP